MYKNLTIIFKNNPDSEDDFDGTYSVDYERASFQVTNQHFILHLQKEDEGGNPFVEGNIFNIKSIKSYKIT